MCSAKSPLINHWEHFDHKADIGVRGFGETPETAFVQAAHALTAIVTDGAMVNPNKEVKIYCSAPDIEILLVEWLNAIIYEMAVRDMLFSRFDVRIKNNRLNAEIWGEAIDREKHHPAVEPKGATLTELNVIQEASGNWIAQCVVDV